jgi:hypothetical protein
MYNIFNNLKLPIYLISLIIFSGCVNDSATPSKVEEFCEKIKIGSSFESVNNSLNQFGLENHNRAPEADIHIRDLVKEPYTVDGVMITSKNLPYFKVVPACVVYFSSILYGGDDRIIHKHFIKKVPEGI